MIIGIPKEIKGQEYRVALMPSGAAELVRAGHEVLIETGAGLGSGFSDIEYLNGGARIVSVAEAWGAQLVVKVKEPLSSEYDYLQGQIIFTFLHLAGVEKELTYRLLNSGTTAIAYETLEDEEGRLPILAPMSAIAGNMAALVGSYYLARFNQGNGVQLGKVLGQKHGKALIIGDGVVGLHAARTLNGIGANVFLAGLDKEKVGLPMSGELEGVESLYSEEKTIARHSLDADLVIGSVLRVGQKAPHVVTEAMIKKMGRGTVIVDVSIDQGGCIETSKATTHNAPVYIQHGVTHYCVANMPGAYPRTATIALCSVSLVYIHFLVGQGLTRFMSQYKGAVNIHNANIFNENVALNMGL
ncbi:MAG: alanine dehydrogenase [Methyloprofundus sp.]|nr:alanine dehydrogenase [Methyloprofundus sp.]